LALKFQFFFQKPGYVTVGKATFGSNGRVNDEIMDEVVRTEDRGLVKKS
jgi:hypothetical protein